MHRLEQGLPLRVGGVDIAHTHGLVAHSDGDVLLHALCDALLGAVALRDIGTHFSDSDPQYKGIDSCILLERVYEMVQQQGYELVNADCTIIAQAPKFAPHIASMRTRIAELLNANESQINVKATTTEKLGFEGRGEGISSLVTVMVKKK